MNIINRFTLRTLLKNKVRTFVTILGIILATAMFVFNNKYNNEFTELYA